MATNKSAKSEGVQIITIKPTEIEKANITIVGDTPLIVHAWGEKAKKEMLAAQQKDKKAKKAMDIRDPFAEFMDAMYWVTPKPEERTPKAFEQAIQNGAKFGFPVIAIKQAALSACYRAGLIPNQVGMKCSFYLNAVDGITQESGLELGVIETDNPPALREDMVKIGGMSKTADLRYRPEFKDWKMRLTISLIATGAFTMTSIINGINMAGMMNGIGEWRMERDGEFGHYHVEVDGE